MGVHDVTKTVGSILVIAGFMMWFAGPPALADTEELKSFYGTYVGQSDPVPGGERLKRDLGVSIVPTDDNGFRLTWTTARHKRDGRRKEHEITIEFVPIRREGLYSSAMRRNKFGHRIPLDPLKGDPYVWARVLDKTLTVHAMIITEDGGYEMQVYKRTLFDSGINLRFDRVRDGITLRSITGTLRRVGD